MVNTVFSKSDCIEHYTWGDDCHGWTFVDTDTLSVKQELMPPDTAAPPMPFPAPVMRMDDIICRN